MALSSVRHCATLPADRRLRAFFVRLGNDVPDFAGGVREWLKWCHGHPQCVRRDPGPQRRPFSFGPLMQAGAFGATRAFRAADHGVSFHTGWLIVRDALVMGKWHDIDRRSRPTAAPDGLGRRAHPSRHGALRQRQLLN